CRFADRRLYELSTLSLPDALPILVFDTDPGEGIVVAMSDMRERFRLTANVVDIVPPDAELPKLPVARAVWEPRPDFTTSATAWLDRKSTRLNSSHVKISYAVFCLK